LQPLAFDQFTHPFPLPAMGLIFGHQEKFQKFITLLGKLDHNERSNTSDLTMRFHLLSIR